MADKRELAAFLAEVSEWRWDEFVKAELDDSYTTNQSVVFSLVRACAMENLPAIKTALGRMDGKLVTPVQVIMPKVYITFPFAKEAKRLTVAEEQPPKEIVVFAPGQPELAEERPTKGFRETVAKMGGYPRETPKGIIEQQEQVEKYLRREGRMPEKVPRVKSVVAAHFLSMAQKRDMEALNEVFDQLDGKLTETIKVIGEDMYITSFDSIAPPGAFIQDGVLTVEAGQIQDMWRKRLDGKATAFLDE